MTNYEKENVQGMLHNFGIVQEAGSRKTENCKMICGAQQS